MPSEKTAADQLERMSRLMALQLIMGRKQPDQMVLLAIAGWAPQEIATFLGTTPNNVRVTLSRRRTNGRLLLPGEPEK